MPSSKVVIDVVFIALVVVAASITAVVLARVMTNAFAGVHIGGSQSEQKAGVQDGTALVITDPEASQDSETFESPDPDGETVEFSRSSLPVAESGGFGQFADSLYGASPYILPITWGAVGGTLIWRGKVRSAWSRQGYDYDTFRLVAKMRGSPTRIRLLNAIGSPKNKLQLAKELEVDWKTVDNHIEMLMQGGLVEEKSIVGTAKYYVITENGTRVLSLLSDNRVGGRDEGD